MLMKTETRKMTIYAKGCSGPEVSHSFVLTEAAGLRRSSTTSQVSKRWPRHFLFDVVFISALCARLPSAGACQQELLPKYCFWEHQDKYHQCPTLPSERIGCTYAVINSTEKLRVEENSANFPSQPRGVAIRSYTCHFQGVRECGHVFNITWKLPQDASFKYLEGFLLNITFVHKNETQRFLRHFKVQTKDLEAIDLSQIVFHYDCFVPRPNTFFNIRLQSLPIAPLGMSNDVWQSLQTYDNEVDVDSNNTGNWKASIWVKSFETISSSLEVCFTTAPADFRFARYNVYLVSSNALRLIRYSATIEVSQKENAADACYTFADVCSDTYRIEVEPESYDGSDCKCKLGSKCVALCAASVFERADMTHSALRCPPIAHTPSSDSQTSTTGNPFPLQPGMIYGFVVGLFLGLVFLVLLGFLVWKRWHAPNPKKVFVLDSSETRIIEDFVGLLVDFLRKRSGCQVQVLSDWLRPDADSNLDKLWDEVVNSDCTIFVMSDECRRRYHDAMTGVIKPPSRRSSVIGNAVVAMIMRIMWSNECESVRRKCFEVCLPGARECHDLDKAVQRSYRLPGEIADLVWEIRGDKIPRFYFMKIWKLVVWRKMTRDWDQNAVALNMDCGAPLLGETPALPESPARLKHGPDGSDFSSCNNNRESFENLNQDSLETEYQTMPLKREVSNNDSGFSGSIFSDIVDMLSFKPPLPLNQSSSTLSASVGHDGESILFSSSYNFSSTSVHDDGEQVSLASFNDYRPRENYFVSMFM